MMDFIEEFKNHLSFERQLSKNTILAYVRDIKQFLDYCQLNNVKLHTVTPEFLDTYIYHLKAEVALAPASVFRKTEAIRAFYKFLIIENEVKEDQSRFLLSPRLIRRIPKQLSVQEMEKLLSFPAKSFGEWRTLCIINIFYASGIRVSELINLRIESVNTKEGWLLAYGKGRKQRFIPVHQQACTILQKYLEIREITFIKQQTDSEIFLNRNGKKVSRITVWKDIEALGRLAGITQRVHPHLFRHSFASHLLKGGADLRAIQEMLGHESLNTTQIYTHLNVGDLKAKHKKLHPRS